MANKTDGEVEKSIISSDMKIKGKITASGGLVLLGNVAVSYTHLTLPTTR